MGKKRPIQVLIRIPGIYGICFATHILRIGHLALCCDDRRRWIVFGPDRSEPMLYTEKIRPGIVHSLI